MPLKAGKSKKVINKNIGEMIGSKTFASGKDQETRRRMAVAAAMSKAGKARKGK